jgi:hypothetical protein
MSDRKLRRVCESRLRALALPEPFDLDMVCEVLATRRGRQIRLCATVLPRPLYGIWLTGHDADHILYEEATSAAHQHQIILHELSHLICGHRPHLRADDLAAASLAVTRHQFSTRMPMLRTTYSAADEREAELMATLLLARMTASGVPTNSAVAQRLEASYGDERS